MASSKGESKYERLRKIGIGSYGVVFKCVNRHNGQVVAIKRYSENDSDPVIRKIAMREVRTLRQLKHPNLIRLIEVFRRKRRLHLVFDYCELTVLDVIERYGNSCPVNLIKKIVWQIVNGIDYCHRHQCIHRDIKPENILINQAGVVKLCDFGFARSLSSAGSGDSAYPPVAKTMLTPHHQRSQRARHDQSSSSSSTASTPLRGLAEPAQNENRPGGPAAAAAGGQRQALTEYVATRWYRAPELLCGEVYYDAKIDIWAIGCVAAELARGKPICPGKTDLDQLFLIIGSLGPLTADQARTLNSQALYDKDTLNRLDSAQRSWQAGDGAGSLERRLPAKVGPSGVSFVSSCLRMNPAQRPSSDQLLRHAFIESAKMGHFLAGSRLGLPQPGVPHAVLSEQPQPQQEAPAKAPPPNPAKARAGAGARASELRQSQLPVLIARGGAGAGQRARQAAPRKLVASPSPTIARGRLDGPAPGFRRAAGSPSFLPSIAATAAATGADPRQTALRRSDNAKRAPPLR